MTIKSNGGHGGARPGSGPKKGKIKATPLPPSLRNPDRLGSFKGREIPKDAEPDLYEQINFARSQIARCAAGDFSHRRAPTILKAAIALLDEALGKLREKHELSGRVDLAAALDAVEGQRVTPPAARHAIVDVQAAPALPTVETLPQADRSSDREPAPTPSVVAVPECNCRRSGLAMGRHHGDCPVYGSGALLRTRI